MIIDHTHPAYAERWRSSKANKYNGAYYYSQEIGEYFIPHIKTDRNWITINQRGEGIDHSIVFIHNNLHPERYDWLSDYEDLVLVCGVYETQAKVSHLGKTIYLPLSIDTQYVRQFATEKTKEVAFAGRPAKHDNIPAGTPLLQNMPRPKLLEAMAQYRKIYAVGRTAIEALTLGCRLLPYDSRYPNVKRWKVLDSRDAARLLQRKLDEIDR